MAGISANTIARSGEGLPRRRPLRARLAIYLAAAAILLVIAIPLLSYFRAVVAPSNAWVARVDGETAMTRGELVDAIVLRQLLSDDPGDLSALGRAPFLVAQAHVRDRMTRSLAASKDITVTPSEIEAGVRDRFYPQTGSGEQSTPLELDQAYRAAYTNFLSARGVSDNAYRSSVETRLYRERMIEAMGGVAELEAWLTEQWNALDAEVRLDSDVYAQVLADVRASLPRSLSETQGEQ